MKNLFLLIPLLIFLFSCTKEIYSPENLFDLLRKGDPDLTAVTAEAFGTNIVSCDEYKPSCKNVFIVKIKELEVIFLQYDNSEDAFKSANYMDGFVVRNWAIDEVSGEPVLEAFMMKYLGARKAR